MRFASLFLALSLVPAAGCDPGRDDGAAVAPADVDTSPAAVPPPVADPDEDEDGDGDGPDASVPTRYQGSFASDAAACDAPGNPTRLTIGGETIRFHESSGPVTGVASGPSDVAITAELTGEGETREATYRFRLSDDGGTLTDLGSGMERVRCG